jgi:RNA polymerase sigma-70 factor (ECF subfamily)
MKERQRMVEALVTEQAVRELAHPRAAAFRRLVDGELDSAYRLAAAILGDRFEAEDAVHDAAVSAWRHWGDLRDEARFEAWFGRIVINSCRDRMRRSRRRAAIELGRDATFTEHPVTDDGSADAADRDVVRRLLATLPLDERIVVALRFGADLTVPTIADRLQIAEGTVKSRLHAALGRLRRAIEESER